MKINEKRVQKQGGSLVKSCENNGKKERLD
jgi:hypothetical protein